MEKPSYYERHREELCARMREQDARRRAELRSFLEEHPECTAKNRELMRRKYYTTSSNKILKRINILLESEGVSEVLKAFLRDTLIGKKYRVFTPKVMEALELVYAVEGGQNNLERVVDGEAKGTPAPAEDEEASQEEDDDL